MTIKEFIDQFKALDDKFNNQDGEKLSEIIAESTSVWNNDAAKGYLLFAAKALKINDKKVNALLSEMEYTFEIMTVEEAEKYYINH